jgi:hypothetical protein
MMAWRGPEAPKQEAAPPTTSVRQIANISSGEDGESVSSH